MIKSSRTKRRKIKECLDMIISTTENHPPTSSCSNLVPPADNSVSSYDHPMGLMTFSSCDSILNVDSEPSNFIDPPANIIEPFTDIEPLPVVDFKDDLASWAVEYKIPLNAVNGLLSVLKKHDCFSKLPKDSRTLLGTFQNKNYPIRTVEPGIYYHFGIAKGILKHYDVNSYKDVDFIQVAVGFDGLPLSRSSKSQFWPILAYIRNSFSSKDKVFPIGVYHGYAKPKDSDDFILDFVNEAVNLSTNGLDISDKHFKIVFDLFCCDVPAKSFILKIKGHSGFSSCTRCLIEGDYINNRVCFPYCKTESAMRNDYDYRNVVHEEFHTSPNVSIITKIPNLDITKSFILDYMHLTNLGIMRKMISFWVLKGPLNVRLSGRMTNEITSRLLNVRSSMPCEFSRKPREIQSFLQWKATEFRLFLVYLGPFVLKNILSHDCYVNFMSLNVAMIILLSPNKSEFTEYAQQLIEYFVMTFDQIYGNYNVSHNVHGLLHLITDYHNFGPLDQCSCYPFENYMKVLKSALRKHEKPLQQFIHRYEEQCNFPKKIKSKKPILNKDNFMFKKMHSKGPLPTDIIGPQYHRLHFSNFMLNTTVDRESYLMTNCGKIVKCINFANKQVNNKKVPVIVGQYFINKSPAYINPLSSDLLDIYKVENISSDVIILNINTIKYKLMVINVEKEIFAIPIFHSDC